MGTTGSVSGSTVRIAPRADTISRIAFSVWLLLAGTAAADESTWTTTGYTSTTTTIAPLGESDSYQAAARLSDGRRVAVGATRHQPLVIAGSANKNDNFAVALYGVDGILDTDFYPCTPFLLFPCPTPGTAQYNFQTGGTPPFTYLYSDDRAYDVAIRSGATDSVGDDAIFVVGTSALGGADSLGVILKIDSAGSLDTGFDGDGYRLLSVDGLETDIRAAGIQGDGKLVVAGTRGSAFVDQDFFVARFNDDGTLDATFGTGGISIADFGVDTCSSAYDLAVGANSVSGYDDFITLVGDSMDCAETRGHVALARFRPNGVLDVTGGVFPDFHLGFSSDGRHIEEFGTVQSHADAVLIEPDGSTVLAGFMYSTANAGGLLARFGQLGPLAEWDEVVPSDDFGQTYGGTQFKDLARLSTGQFLVTGSAKGGSSGNAMFGYSAHSDLSPMLPLVNLFPTSAGYGYGVLLLGSNGLAIVGAAGGEAAIRQVTYETCGNGVVEFDEECESGDCCESCQASPATTPCRGAADVCDAEETCDGVSPTCPADDVLPNGIPCRASAGLCDVAEACNGVDITCPADGFAAGGTLCRASAEVCDVAETCSGASATCPVDGFEPPTTVCRPSAAICDEAENCSGADALCPADAYKPAGTLCRAGVDLCDADETCTGGGIFCPADAAEPAGTVCRLSVDTCDVTELCDGVDSECPENAFAAAGTPAPVLCDDAEACSADVCDGTGGCDNTGAATSAGIDYDEDGFLTPADDVDTDGDGIIDACDICTSDCNPDQLDTDADCSAVAPWNASAKPECGDVCDVCPSSDEVALALDPLCATFDYNALTGCCEEVGAGVSVGAAGESCGGPAGDTDFTATGSNSSVSVRIPPGAVAEDTSFAADSVDKAADEFFVRGGGGRYVGGWDFSPEGVTFGQPVAVCMSWNDANNNGQLEISEGYDYKIIEANIAPYHVDSLLGEYKLADKCSLVPCGSFDADGFPDVWGHSRYDEISTPLVDESTLGACCGATENKYCFEVYHFSKYAVGDPNCLSDNLDRTKLKVVKLHKEVGEQKVVLTTEFQVPLDETTGQPDPVIDPITNGVQVSLLDLEAVEPTLWSARVEGGAYDKAVRRGWKVNSKATTFTYKARNRADGVSKVVVQTLYNKAPGLVKVKVVAKRAAVPVDGPLVQAELSLDPAGFLDRCAMTSFEVSPSSDGGFCLLNGAGTVLICR